jgi:hypothetical protein
MKLTADLLNTDQSIMACPLHMEYLLLMRPWLAEAEDICVIFHFIIFLKHKF